MGKFTDRPLSPRDSQLLQVLWMLSGSPSGPESDVSGRAPGLCHRVLRKSVLQLLSLASYVWLHSKHKWRNFEIFSFFYCVSSHHFKKMVCTRLKHFILILLQGENHIYVCHSCSLFLAAFWSRSLELV